MDQYRAPVPATLKGATVCRPLRCSSLIGEQQPVLIDVLPKARKPAGREPSQLWIEPRRDDLPGSVWLPNVGLRRVAADFAELFPQPSSTG